MYVKPETIILAMLYSNIVIVRESEAYFASNGIERSAFAYSRGKN